MDFSVFFRNAKIPIIIYRDNETRSVSYLNKCAITQMAPLVADHDWRNPDSKVPVTSLLRMPNGDFERFMRLLGQSGEIIDFFTNITLYSGETVHATLSANKYVLEGEEFVIVFVYQRQASDLIQSGAHEISKLIFKSESTEEAIKSILAFAGKVIGVCRCYIFESISEALTSNTYEWCADGVEPMIGELQEIPKDIYSYDKIIANGLVATNDIRLLESEDRSLLERQGIRALAIIPILFHNEPLGYVGFDDCENYRIWSTEEIQFLQSLSDVFASLISRRNNEQQLDYGLGTLRTIMDNYSGLIFVTSLQTKKMLFANTAFAMSVGSSPEELAGESSATVLHLWASNYGDFDPLSKLVGTDGKRIQESNIWEFHNQNIGKWYLIHDTVVKWIDGSDVLIEILTDITERKKYEDKLKHDASTDSMTGLLLRERGRQIIQQILDKASTTESNSIVFIDLDDLKKTNDRFGHASGDRMILKTIEFILTNIRRSDSLCRWGGDEFVLIMRADERQAEKVMKKIQEQISFYNDLKQEQFALGFSYGIVEIIPNAGHTVDSVIIEADGKMYLNKGK